MCPAYHIISIPLSRPTLILNLVREGLRHEMPTAYTEALTAVVADTDGVHRSIASHYGCNRHAATELISTIARGEQRPWPAWSEEVGFNVLSDRHLQMVCSYAGAVGLQRRDAWSRHGASDRHGAYDARLPSAPKALCLRRAPWLQRHVCVGQAWRLRQA